MKTYIFDLDGVIVHTDRFHYQAWKQMADARNIYFDEAINNRLRGVSRQESLEIILENYDGMLSEEEKEEWMQEKNNIYRSLLSQMTSADVAEEVRETLKELHRRGHKLVIGSSSKNAVFILEKTGLLNIFDAVSDGNNITNSKPDPEVFLKAAKFVGSDTAECIVIEDAYAGIDAAKAAGMTAVGIGDAAGYERADDTLECIADLLKTGHNLK